MITFAWEKGYDKFYAEAKPLIRRHWDEVGTHRDVLTLNPRHDVYLALESRGALEILTARVGIRLVGYFFLLFTPHPRDVTKILAQDDIVYADPEFRREWLGYKLTKIALARAEERATVICFHEKLSRNYRGTYLRRLGFEPREVAWTKIGKLG